MARRYGSNLHDRLCDLPTWTNILVTDETPITWVTEAGTPEPGDELAGRLVIGEEQQLIIDLCGTAVTNLLAVLAEARRGAEGATIEACTERAQDCAPTP